MLKRKAYDKLLEWKKEDQKKALCIIGARQIGKTTVDKPEQVLQSQIFEVDLSEL